ncbi:MAG: KamA family radical SAM protein [Proteobacteria bacterium]|nr:KamA family radical SAM protein [Desulfobulbaceae bacterium]MBU4151412.1 KamA family radical SAM protein [Pseudomonadota bacterium]
MAQWHQIVQKSIVQPTQLAARFSVDLAGMAEVVQRYPMRINPYYLGLIREVNDPIWRQAVPDPVELSDTVCFQDPLAEETLSPVPNLIHKYPDRALFLVTSQCAMYCRFCTRKRKVGTERMVITDETIQAGLDYIRRTPAIRDVLVSGGDPLLLPDEMINKLLAALRSIPTVEIIRIGSRVPCVLPMRVTRSLVSILKRYHPLYINTHFNHPVELTTEAALACGRLIDAGIPLGCQTVLLRGVNDTPEVMRSLMQGLLRIRVKPYYIFQADMTQGTNHFRTSIDTGLSIMRSLIGHTSGLAVPTYAVDAPGGGGKIPLVPDYVIEKSRTMIFENYCGTICSYVDGG